jgi:phospholipase C
MRAWTRLIALAAAVLPLVIASRFFEDLRGGTLPAVSWIVPSFCESEHPPANNLDSDLDLAQRPLAPFLISGRLQ